MIIACVIRSLFVSGKDIKNFSCDSFASKAVTYSPEVIQGGGFRGRVERRGAGVGGIGSGSGGGGSGTGVCG